MKNKIYKSNNIEEGKIKLNSDCKGISEEPYDNDEIYFVKHKPISLLRMDAESIL